MGPKMKESFQNHNNHGGINIEKEKGGQKKHKIIGFIITQNNVLKRKDMKKNY